MSHDRYVTELTRLIGFNVYSLFINMRNMPVSMLKIVRNLYDKIRE
jgi:hypothetical protein